MDMGNLGNDADAGGGGGGGGGGNGSSSIHHGHHDLARALLVTGGLTMTHDICLQAIRDSI